MSLSVLRRAWLSRLPEHIRNSHLALVDMGFLELAGFMAFWLRFETVLGHPYVGLMFAYVIAAPLVKLPIFLARGIYNRYWRYAGPSDVVALVQAVLMTGLIEVVLFYGLAPLVGLARIPRSIPVIDAILTLCFIGGSRFGVRILSQRARRWHKAGLVSRARQPVLIVGAGEAGALVARELEANPQAGLQPVCFVDDDPHKRGMRVRGCPVLGDRQAIPQLVLSHAVAQVIIALPSASGSAIKEILALCHQADVPVRTLPGVYDVLAGRVTLNQLREVRIEDLLRRQPVEPDATQMAGLLRGRRVLVTGAGGSIGSELCRQIMRWGPARLVLLGHGENSIFEIHNELLALGGGNADVLSAVIADVRSPERLCQVFEAERPEIVFHAAAHKHVPLMEANPADAVMNNVEGTANVVVAAESYGVEHFVLISTDKAINPTSVMGATKRAAELIVQAAARRTGRAYVSVRFGNVLGSRGSVVPAFQRQIAAGGPVTITHPDMRRYFMTIPEAAQLVLQAGVIGQGGEVFVLDMGEPVRIVDLAGDLIRLSGYEPGRDIEIKVTGLRPGEKLFEELFSASEVYERTAHVKIFVCANGHCPEDDGEAALASLIAAAHQGVPEEVRRRLQVAVPEYQPASDGDSGRHAIPLVGVPISTL